MSAETSAWAKEQRCGDPVTKAVLMEIANWAKPNGLCEYLPVKRIADVVEVSTRTVKRHIARLESPDPTEDGLGLIRRVGRHGENGAQLANGFELVGYQPPLSAFDAPGDRLSPPRVKSSPPGDADDIPPGDNSDTPPVTIVSPDKSLEKNPRAPPSGGDTPPIDEINGKGADPATSGAKAGRLPDGWEPPELGELPAKARRLVEQWPAGAYEAACETFRLHWTAETGPLSVKGNWTAALGKWLITDHPKVIRDAKAGVSFAALAPSGSAGSRPARASRPVEAKRHEDERSETLHRHFRRELGAMLYETWFEPAAFRFGPGGLVCVFPSEFSRSWVQEQFGQRIMAAAEQATGAPVESIRFEVETVGRIPEPV